MNTAHSAQWHKLPLFAILLGCMLFFTACSSNKKTVEQKAETVVPAEQQEIEAVILVSPDGLEIVVPIELADEPDERSKGLMFRESLKEGTGMLFVFDREQPLNFWMKNTLIPLDILYFDDDGQFVSALTMVPCNTVRCAQYPSGKPAKYALEVNAGFVEEKGVAEGWKLIVQR